MSVDKGRLLALQKYHQACTQWNSGDAEQRAEAVTLFKVAAEADIISAQECLGMIYEQAADGVPDLGKATYWYQLAAFQGSEFARVRVENIELQRGKAIEEKEKKYQQFLKHNKKDEKVARETHNDASEALALDSLDIGTKNISTQATTLSCEKNTDELAIDPSECSGEKVHTLTNEESTENSNYVEKADLQTQTAVEKTCVKDTQAVSPMQQGQSGYERVEQTAAQDITPVIPAAPAVRRGGETSNGGEFAFGSLKLKKWMAAAGACAVVLILFLGIAIENSSKRLESYYSPTDTSVGGQAEEELGGMQGQAEPATGATTDFVPDETEIEGIGTHFMLFYVSYLEGINHLDSTYLTYCTEEVGEQMSKRFALNENALFVFNGAEIDMSTLHVYYDEEHTPNASYIVACNTGTYLRATNEFSGDNRAIWRVHMKKLDLTGSWYVDQMAREDGETIIYEGRTFYQG